jgi:hypothetical protein
MTETHDSSPGDDTRRTRRAGSRGLDFIVIGAQKAGTTTLWQHLRHHPSITMPERKEEPFFCYDEADQPGAFDAYMDAHFGSVPNGALLGKATPHYMMGQEAIDVGGVAKRIFDTLPGVRLIALLRDPIERAASQHRMSVRRGWEERSFERAIEEGLDPSELARGRRHPTETNSYIAQGEYGRILGAYRRRFPATQLHVELTEDLADDPAAVIDRILTFLSLPTGYRPRRPEARLHRGGIRKLLDTESRTSLGEFLEERVWPRLGDDAPAVKRDFNAFLEIWNVAPDDSPPPIDPAVRARLEQHYEGDAKTLASLGVAAPWIEAWRAGAAS